MKPLPLLLSAAVLVLASVPASAQSGPVGRACKSEIASICAGHPHDGSARICLEFNYDRLSAACRRALDSTGGGRGRRFQR
jgi:hypothetical protein